VQRVEQVLIRYTPEDFAGALLAILQKELEGPGGRVCRVLLLFPTTRWLQFFYVLLKHRIGIRHLWALHGKLPDEKRRACVALFLRGAPPVHGVLFATDLAARGLDFDVDAVVQVGVPPDREQYVHRVGRTGRLVASGRSLLLINPLEEAVVLRELQGLDLRNEPVPSSSPLTVSLEDLRGWWQDGQLARSGTHFFSNVISFYLNRRKRFQARPAEILHLAASLLKSTGYPVEQGLPPVSLGLEKKIKDQDPLCGIRSASDEERFSAIQGISHRQASQED